MRNKISLSNVENEIVNSLKNCNIDRILTLPCDRIKNLLPLISANFNEIPLTREEEGIGVAAGLYLSGERPAMLIQNTGIGNSLTALSSLHLTYNLPLPILVSWRGIYKEGISAHVHFGKGLIGILNGANIPHITVGSVKKIECIQEMINSSFKTLVPNVALLSPRLWENSTIESPRISELPHERIYDINGYTVVPVATHTKYEMIKGIISYIKEKIIVGNIGFTSRELYSIFDQPTNFYMLGSLGLATSIGTGLAIGQNEREVIVLDGDGGLLMNPNALFTLGQENPKKLTIIAFDNNVYASTGFQDTYSMKIDLELLAKVCGVLFTRKVSTPKQLLEVLEEDFEGPRFIHAIILKNRANVPYIPLSPVDIKKRFMKAISD